MMGTDLLKKATDVLDGGLIEPSLDGVVLEEAQAVLAVGDQIETSVNGRGGGPILGPNPLEGTDFTCVVGRTKGPDPVWSGLISYGGGRRESGKHTARLTPTPARQSRP